MLQHACSDERSPHGGDKVSSIKTNQTYTFMQHVIFNYDNNNNKILYRYSWGQQVAERITMIIFTQMYKI